MPQVPVALGVFTWPADEPQLIGSRCTDCGNVAFPTATACARCSSTSVEEHLLARRGTLWTWTTQGFPVKEPYIGSTDPFEPYGLGYVELDGEVRVEARLTTADPDQLRIGMDMELTLVPLRHDGDDEIVTYAFTPVAG